MPLYNPPAAGGSGVWGAITGVIGDQTDLDTELDAKEVAGTAAAAIIAHEGDANPHPGYLTEAEADTLYEPLGGGGGFTGTRATVTLPYPAKKDHTVNVIDAAVTTLSNIVLSLFGSEDTVVNSGDLVDLLNMQARPLAGSFDLKMSFLTPIAGPLTVVYGVG